MEDVPVYLNSFQNMNVSPHSQPGRRVCLSADEAAIRRRGKRRIPASFSPERAEDGGPVSPVSPVSPVTTRTGSEVAGSRREVVGIRKKLFPGGDGSVQSDTSPASPASPASPLQVQNLHRETISQYAGNKADQDRSGQSEEQNKRNYYRVSGQVRSPVSSLQSCLAFNTSELSDGLSCEGFPYIVGWLGRMMEKYEDFG